MPDDAANPATCPSMPQRGSLPPPDARVFRPDRVLRAQIESILDLARRAPSGVNTQPWNVSVLQAASRDALVELALVAVPALLADADAQSRFWDRFKRLPGGGSWPGPAWEKAGGDFLACANAAFGGGALRTEADLARYFEFDGAPVALVLTIDSALGLGSVLDCGMFLQNIATAAAARGLHTVVQTGWKGLSDMALSCLDAPDGFVLVAVMAMGHADPAAARDARSHQPQAFTLWHA